MDSLSTAPTTEGRGPPRFWAGLLARLQALLGGDWRQGFVHYVQVLAGTLSRLFLQAAYFFLLVNALSLEGMGVFASASAVGLMLASFSGLGFGALAFRAAAGKTRLLAPYVAMTYAGLALMLPIGIIVSLPIYWLIFADIISLPAFVGIIAVEVFAWRLIEFLQQVNAGLGRFTTASVIITLGGFARALAAGVFALLQSGDVEEWALYFIVSNFAVAALLWVIYRPRVRLRWSRRLFRARFRDSMAFALAYFSYCAQSQLDKIIVLSLTNATIAGIYAIATRLIDFTTVPFRSFYVLYCRKLIAEVRPRNLVRRGLKVEAIIAVTSTIAFAALVGILLYWPNLLGKQVAEAVPFLMLLLAVPAFKNLLEFHGELFFAMDRMQPRVFVAFGLVALNAGCLALLLSTTATLAQLGIWLNAVFAVLYLLSAAAVYRFVTGRVGREGTGGGNRAEAVRTA